MDEDGDYRMEFQLIRTEAEFDNLAAEWNALLEESANHVPFLQHEYLRIWWENRGGGEWPQAELAIVTARDAENRLVGIAPLFYTHNLEGEPALMLLGSIEVSDYLDVIARPQDLAPFIEQLLPFLASAKLPEWKVLDWFNLMDSSPSLGALETAAKSNGWAFLAEKNYHCPYIPLPGDWEAYLQTIDKKQRHEIRRKVRRLETSGTASHWYIVEDPNQLEPEAEAFMNLMAKDPEKAAFLTEAMRHQFMETMRCAFEKGCLQLAFLEIGGEKAAAYLSFDYLDRIWVYNSGLDRNLMDYSPGWVLLAYLLEWANNHQRHEFDFMRGDEDYKYRFGAIDRFVVRARVSR
jgi:CelD/BcsL family acetyltransferase involved in cellulose biosynthesis